MKDSRLMDLKSEYESNKSKFKGDDTFKFLYGYQKVVRITGKYNPANEGFKVMELIGCNDWDTYFDIMWNYGTLMPKYFPEYCKKYYPDLLK